jgi:hypothetical protein
MLNSICMMHRMRQRASTLIQKYAGSQWQAAQRTPWLLNVVCHIDLDYRHYMLDQARMIKHLQHQAQQLQCSDAEAASQAASQVRHGARQPVS